MWSPASLQIRLIAAWDTVGSQLTKCYFCLQAALILFFTWCSFLECRIDQTACYSWSCKVFGIWPLDEPTLFISIYFIFWRQGLMYLRLASDFVIREDLVITLPPPSRFWVYSLSLTASFCSTRVWIQGFVHWFTGQAFFNWSASPSSTFLCLGFGGALVSFLRMYLDLFLWPGKWLGVDPVDHQLR